MSADHTIAKVLPGEKPWQNGIVYYTVEIEGHVGQVSIGKKTRPQAGMVVYGDIEETPDGLPSKFKSASRPLEGSYTPQAATATSQATQGVDPTRNSIERQKALAEAVNYVNGQDTYKEEATRLEYVITVAGKFVDFLDGK